MKAVIVSLIVVASCMILVELIRRWMTRNAHRSLRNLSAIIDRSSLPFVFTFAEDLGATRSLVLDELQAAANFINDSVGYEIFAQVGSSITRPGKRVLVSNQLDFKSDEAVVLCCYDNAICCSLVDSTGDTPAILHIDTSRVSLMDSKCVEYALMHELGHIVGLAHDDILDSVMFPKQLQKEPRVTDRDVQFIRLAYDLDRTKAA